MRVTVLGIWGAYPEAASCTSSFLLAEGKYNLLLECGSGVLSQLQRHLPLAQLDAVLLSHYHHDHIADVRCLQYATLVQMQLKNRRNPLPIYGHAQDKKAFSSLHYGTWTQGFAIREGKIHHIGPWQVSFCATTHTVPCLAARLEASGKAIVYTADTEWREPLVEFAHGADLIICEASLYREQQGHVKGHLTGRQAGELAARAKAKRLLLTHLPHFGDHNRLLQEAMEVFNGNVQLAAADLELDV